jgi:dihydropteroate synthase
MIDAPLTTRTSPDSPSQGRANFWQLRERRLALPPRPLVMGILNVTPDSFSDGGHYFDASAAIERGLRMAAEGADILDIGGESSRPYAERVDVDSELARVIPVIQALRGRLLIPLSIDTTKAAVAREAVAAGVEVINDISALESDPEMVEVALATRAGICAMHMQGTPQTMQDHPAYDNVVEDIFDYLRGRRDALVQRGLDPARIALDPGIGFGKTHQHNLTLLAHCDRFHALGCPLVVGHSRKGYIGKILDDATADRTAGTIGVSIALALQGVQVLRVHDVEAVRQALLLFEAVGGLGRSLPS